MAVDLIVKNCSIATPAGRTGPGMGVAADDGKIVAVGRGDRLGSAHRTIDAGGDVLAPGLVDTHVHTRDPGFEHREDFETASRAAAAGGVTTFFAMPNTEPRIDDVDHLEHVRGIGERKSLVDFTCYGYLSPENVDQLEPLVEAGVPGFKAYLATSSSAMPIFTDGALREAMKTAREAGTRLAFHAENEDIITYYGERFREAGRNAPIDHARSRPVLAEVEAVSRLLLLAEDTGCPISVVHLSSGSAAERIAEAKRTRDVDVLAEGCPHYLRFSEELLREKGNFGRINPPLRPPEEREKLWEAGIHGGGIDYLGTDHAPYTDEDKHADDPFHDTWEASSGAANIEIQAPAFLTFVNEGRLSMEHWLSLHAAGSATAWGLYPEKGSLQVGTDADFFTFDPDHEWTLDRADLHSKNTVTPFDGASFTGRVTRTVARGEVVYADGEVTGEPGYGRAIGASGDA